MDSKYDNLTQQGLIDTTKAWYNAETKTEEAKALKKLKDIRKESDSGLGKVMVDVSKFTDGLNQWYLWAEEAFKKAEREDKPIFLSIGYSTCHR